MVYYHFIEKFDHNDRHIVIAFKDDNKFHLHWSNLDKSTFSESRYKTFQMNRARNRNYIYSKAVSQYTVEEKLVAEFKKMYEAEKIVGTACESIVDAVDQQYLTAGGFKWFLQIQPPRKKILWSFINRKIPMRFSIHRFGAILESLP